MITRPGNNFSPTPTVPTAGWEPVGTPISPNTGREVVEAPPDVDPIPEGPVDPDWAREDQPPIFKNLPKK